MQVLVFIYRRRIEVHLFESDCIPNKTFYESNIN